jgi:hypothetical protein
MEISTLKALRAAINAPSTKFVLAQVRFGCSEDWMKLRKEDALKLARGDGTPDDLEMYAGIFGRLDGDTLYLG